MDVHEVEASGRRIIERGSEAANRGFFSRMLDSARETLESLRPSSPGNEVGPNNSEENNRILDLSNSRGEENSSNPSEDATMDDLMRRSAEELSQQEASQPEAVEGSLRQSSTGSSVSSTSTASSETSDVALANQNITVKEVTRVEQMYHKEGGAFLTKEGIHAFGGTFTAGVVLNVLQQYKDLKISCTDIFFKCKSMAFFKRVLCSNSTGCWLALWCS